MKIAVRQARRVALHLPLGLALAVVWLLASTPVSAQTQPKRARLAAGEIRPDLLYHNYCSVCHGDKGDGRSRARNSLSPPPRDFTEPAALNSLTREAMIAFVTHGKAGTAMTAWNTQLSTPEIEALVDYMRATFMAPRMSPAFARGREVYAQSCTGCHGARGQGVAHGPLTTRDLSTPQARLELTREQMIGTAAGESHRRTMGAAASKASAEDIIAAVDFIRIEFMATQTASVSGTQAHGGRGADSVPSTRTAASALPKDFAALAFPNGLNGNAARGKVFYDANCATCHGLKGDAQGPRAYFINPKPRNFITEAARAALSRPVLFAAVSVGRPGTDMPAWDKVIDAQQIADVSEYVFTAFIRPAASQRVASSRRP